MWSIGMVAEYAEGVYFARGWIKNNEYFFWGGVEFSVGLSM
jgi:hypothetical protein